MYDELSVRNLWPEMKKDAAFMQYFPEKFPKDKGPSREYFFDILNILYPEYLAKIMGHAARERMMPDADANKKEAIEISEYWAEQLKAMPYTSCKSIVVLLFT